MTKVWITVLGILQASLVMGQVEVRMIFSPGGAQEVLAGTHYSYLW